MLILGPKASRNGWNRSGSEDPSVSTKAPVSSELEVFPSQVDMATETV